MKLILLQCLCLICSIKAGATIQIDRNAGSYIPVVVEIEIPTLKLLDASWEKTAYQQIHLLRDEFSEDGPNELLQKATELNIVTEFDEGKYLNKFLFKDKNYSEQKKRIEQFYIKNLITIFSTLNWESFTNLTYVSIGFTDGVCERFLNRLPNSIELSIFYTFLPISKDFKSIKAHKLDMTEIYGDQADIELFNKSLVNLPESLSELRIRVDSLNSLKFLAKLEKLENLTIINLSNRNAKDLTFALEVLPNLKTLEIGGGTILALKLASESLLDFSITIMSSRDSLNGLNTKESLNFNFPHLKTLFVNKSNIQKEITCNCESLEKIEIHGSNISFPNFIYDCFLLNELKISGCDMFKIMPHDSAFQNLEKLSLSSGYCDGITIDKDVVFPQLKEFNISQGMYEPIDKKSKTANLTFLKNSSQKINLFVEGINLMRTFKSIKNINSIEILTIYDSIVLTYWKFIKKLKYIQEIVIVRKSLFDKEFQQLSDTILALSKKMKNIKISFIY